MHLSSEKELEKKKLLLLTVSKKTRIIIYTKAQAALGFSWMLVPGCEGQIWVSGRVSPCQGSTIMTGRARAFKAASCLQGQAVAPIREKEREIER